MKIKFVTTYPPTRCGIANHAKHLSDSLEKISVKPEIIQIKKPNSSNLFYFLKLAKKTSKGTSKEDLIHIQFQLTMFGKCFGMLPGLYIIPFLFLLKLSTPSKIIMALHDSPTKRYVLGKEKKVKILFFYHKFIYLFLRIFVDQFITHSKNGTKINLEEWKLSEKKVTSIPMGLPTNIDKLNKKLCKKKLGYPNKKMLLILGYIRNSKNYEMILKSLKHLDENVILLIAGTPQLKKDNLAYRNILKTIAKFNLEKRVKLLGFVKEEDMPILLNATDVGITLHSQGGGDFLSSTMAMQLAYNIPLLSTSIPSFENLKKEEKCLETFKEKNLKDLTKKINDLLYNQSKIRELKINSKRYWNKNNWDEVGRKTKNLYLSLLNKI